MCDEIFGRQNFVANVIWHKKHTRANDAKWLSDNHDHIIVYAKLKEIWRPNLLPRTSEMDSKFKNPDNDPRGPWSSQPIQVKTPSESCIYEIENPAGKKIWPPKGRSWQFSKARYLELVADNQIWFGKDGTNVPRIKKFLTDVQDGLVSTTIWPHQEVDHNQGAKSEMKYLFPESHFDTPKPERLIQRILTLGSNKNDWVLDSFAGSGTTGAVAQKMNRKWIMCELGEHCHTHIIPRMQKVTDSTDQGGISKIVNWKGGGGFKYYRLAESLLVKDKDLSTDKNPVYVINPKYDEVLLIKSICKIENFKYRKVGRLHGVSSEKRFLHITTRLFTQAYMESLAEDIGKDQSLLIYCTRKSKNLNLPDNVEIKKIPKNLLEKCDFEEDKK